MPWAAIGAIAAAAATATEAGVQLSGAGQPSPGKELQNQLTAEAQANQKAQQEAQQTAYKRAAPDAQAQAGSGLGGNAFYALIQQLAGQTGGLDEVQNLVSGGSSSNPGGGVGTTQTQGLAH